MLTSALGAEIREGLLELEEDMYLAAEGEGYASFDWKGKTVRCVPNMQSQSSELVFGGLDNVADGDSLIVRRDYFITADSTLFTADDGTLMADDVSPKPVAGRRITFRGASYKIRSAGLDSTGVFFRLVLADKNSGK